MEPTTEEAPPKRRRVAGREKTQIPQETMLEVLLWLDRFDLDAKQVTTKRLRFLIENNQMPLRKLYQVDYDGEERRHWDSPVENNTLSICPEEDEEGEPRKVRLQIVTDEDAQKAVTYISCCFVRYFNVYGHRSVLPRNEVIGAPALMHELYFQYCNFDKGEEYALSKTLNGGTFSRLVFVDSSIPVWQIDDKLLESLRLRGCNEIHVDGPYSMEPYDDTENFSVTEEGILSYCFTLDDDSPLPESRTLRINESPTITITPAFFRKVVQSSNESHLTCDVELGLEHLRFDIDNLDVGVPPSRYQEYDRDGAVRLFNVRYNIPDHGNGVRLLMHFKSEDGEHWEVTVRHGKKDSEEFFEPKPDGYSPRTEYLEHSLYKKFPINGTG